MDYFSFTSSVTSPQGYVHPIYQINKLPVKTGAITMLTDKWAYSTPKGFDVLLVSSDGKVADRLSASSDAQVMSDGSFALCTNYEINGYFDNFQIGDEVILETSISPDVEKIKEATGGNTILVENGEVAKFTNNVTGRAQRSSVGMTKDGKTLILAVTDGRGVTSPGLTQDEMANLMIYLGADKAINLDGGGSSCLTVQNTDGSYVNKNNVTYERPISTAIGVFDERKVLKTAESGIITPSQKNLFKGESISFDVKFFDKYGGIFPYQESKVKYYDSAGKTINKEKYTPENSGKQYVYAKLGTLTVACEINVIDSLSSIELDNEKINLEKGKSHIFKVYGYGEKGEKVLLDSEKLEWFTDSENIELANGKVTLTGDGSAILGVRYGSLTDHAIINKGSYDGKMPLPKYSKDKLEGYIEDGVKIAISGDTIKGATLLSRLVSIKRIDAISSYDKAFVASATSSEKLPENVRLANGYSEEIIEKSAFITLDTKNGYPSKGSDWQKLRNILMSDVRNVIITTSVTPDKFDEYEKNMMNIFLEDAVKSGKQIFWVTTGEVGSVKFENGVRYITAGIVSDYNKENIEENSLKCAYVRFSCKGEDIRYDFVK